MAMMLFLLMLHVNAFAEKDIMKESKEKVGMNATENNQPKKDEIWLTTLITRTPQEGFELAVKLSRMGVKITQPDTKVLKKLRADYANNADSLTAASQVIALNFQTIAAANNYWR